MGKKIIKKSTAVTLVLALMSSTLSGVLSGCENASISNIYSPTYEDTALETESQKLTSAYDKFDAAVYNGNATEIENTGNALKDTVQEFIKAFDEYNQENKEYVSSADKIIQERQAEFETTAKATATNLISAVDAVIENSDNISSAEYKNSISKISEIFSSNNIMTTSDELVPNAVKNKEVATVEIESLDAYKESKVSAVSSSSPTEDSLAVTDETQLTDEIKALADQLKTPLNVYLYIKNNINYETYYGSRKGAIATFESNAGNDVDQASLLIAMLRYLNYPAKYVTGQIVIDNQQALDLTLASDVSTAGSILAAAGKPVTALTIGGKTVGFKIEQTWVQAYVPYTDYRGAGNNSGESLWVPLDPSIKSYTRV